MWNFIKHRMITNCIRLEIPQKQDLCTKIQYKLYDIDHWKQHQMSNCVILLPDTKFKKNKMYL